jgi:D-glycero-D-manno-heptose 1,7-bisphosphate phosphatase
MKYIFLDRDGVINADPGKYYVTRWEEFSFLPGVLDALRLLSDNGYEIMVISNQSGISRGIFTQEDLSKITRNMLREIKKHGARIKSVHYCPHRDEDNCGCRKPKPGLFHEALRGMNPDIKNVFFVGDSPSDIVAGKNIGCRTILVLSGKTMNEGLDTPMPDFVAEDLAEAVGIVLREDGNPDNRPG